MTEVTHAGLATLFRPLTVGGLTLANRIVMSPMTREFSPGGVPGEDVAAYYGWNLLGSDDEWTAPISNGASVEVTLTTTT